jgi:serine/threonine protein kinase
MSPEQTSGAGVDQRSDIWSFGCVLFEMLTGLKAFAFDRVSDGIRATLNDDPNWNLIPSITPLDLTAVLCRCLAKDPDRRFQNVSEILTELTVSQYGSSH